MPPLFTFHVYVLHGPLSVDRGLPLPVAHEAAVTLACPLLVRPRPHDLDRVHLSEGRE